MLKKKKRYTEIVSCWLKHSSSFDMIFFFSISRRLHYKIFAFSCSQGRLEVNQRSLVPVQHRLYDLEPDFVLFINREYDVGRKLDFHRSCLEGSGRG